MRTFRIHEFLPVLIIAAALLSSCRREEPGGGAAAGRSIVFSDCLDAGTDTKAGGNHVGHGSTIFDVGAEIQVCIDYYHKSTQKAEEEVADNLKHSYVCSAPFQKQATASGQPKGGIFTSETYEISWLDDYFFDMYATYPHDVNMRDLTDAEKTASHLGSEINYHIIDVTYATEYIPEGETDPVRCGAVPQYFKDSDGNWYACTGATLFNLGEKDDSGNAVAVEDRKLASDPHDLITSKVVLGQSKQTVFTDHSEDAVSLTFLHRLSRVQPLFVNGLVEDSNVKLMGIGIYPKRVSASYALKRHEWVNEVRRELFRRDETGWYHRPSQDALWDTNPIPDYSDLAKQWEDYFNDAPILYRFTTPYKLTDVAPVMARDAGHDNALVEFRLLPDSEIDCLILHFLIDDATHAYLPVNFAVDKTDGHAPRTVAGHTTKLVLSYQATMITLIYVNVLKDWNPLPDRYVIGDVTIK